MEEITLVLSKKEIRTLLRTLQEMNPETAVPSLITKATALEIKIRRMLMGGSSYWDAEETKEQG